MYWALDLRSIIYVSGIMMAAFSAGVALARWRWWRSAIGLSVAWRLQWFAEFLGLTLVSCGMAHSGKSLIYVFQEFSASIDKAFIFGVGLGAGLSFYGVWTLSRYFLIS